MNILGVRVDFDNTMESVLSKVESFLTDGGKHYICTVNPEFVIDAQADSDFKDILNKSDISVPDGFGLVLAQEYLRKIDTYKRNVLFSLKAFLVGLEVGVSAITKRDRFQKTISGVDLSYEIFKLAEQKGYSVFLLGGWPKDILGKKITTDRDLAFETSEVLKREFPELNILELRQNLHMQRKMICLPST